MSLDRIFLRRVAPRDEVLLAEQRVVLDVDLRIECHDVALVGDDQRVDLDQARVALEIELVERAGDDLELGDLRAFEAETVGERAAVRTLQARRGMNLDADDLLGGLRCDLLDVHAARGRGDEGDAAGVAIEQHAQVQLAGDLRARLDVDLVDRQALGTRLLGREALAQHPRRGRRNVVQRPCELDAARLAAAARVHLRLDHPDAAAEATGCVGSLRGCRGDEARGHRDAVAGEELLGLVFVEVHGQARGWSKAA